MAGFENVDLSGWHIFAIPLRFAKVEREVILTPDHEQAGLLLAHPRLPFRISIDIGPIVVEQVALNVGLARLVEEVEFIGPEIRVVAIEVGIVSDMSGT